LPDKAAYLAEHISKNSAIGAELRVLLFPAAFKPIAGIPLMPG